MRECKFNMDNLRFGEKKNNISLLEIDKDLYLILKDNNDQVISKIKVLPISKVIKLTNFFGRGFNMYLEGKTREGMLIPEQELMESERKIIVTGEDAGERIKKAKELLKNEFEGELTRSEYPREMVYLDTVDNKLRESHMIFRLTKEGNDVKATIHMDNNLPGDQKRIIKFFFTDTTMSQVVDFFREGLSLVQITKSILSKRTEYKSTVGEVSIDEISDGKVEYFSVEIETDGLMDEGRNSDKVDEAAKKIASQLALEDCKVVDSGTEAIYELVSGEDFFVAHGLGDEMQK